MLGLVTTYPQIPLGSGIALAAGDGGANGFGNRVLAASPRQRSALGRNSARGGKVSLECIPLDFK